MARPGYDRRPAGREIPRPLERRASGGVQRRPGAARSSRRERAPTSWPRNQTTARSCYVDGRLVVDNGGVHPHRRASGLVELVRGPHALLILYYQDHGELSFDFEWARNGAPLGPVPAWAFWGRKVGSLARVIPSLLLRTAFEWFELAAVALLIVACVVAAYTKLRAALSPRRCLARDAMDCRRTRSCSTLPESGGGCRQPGSPSRHFRCSCCLGSRSGFLMAGSMRILPSRYYLLSLAGSPVLLLHSFDVLSYYTPLGSTLLILSYRLMSVLFGLGTVVTTAFIGFRAFGRRAALLAAGIVALVAPFVYYSKTANVDVPYVFWYTLSLLFYLRLLQESRLRDYVLFGTTATLAFCTKDQAYALYLTAPLFIVVELWRQNRRDGRSRPLARALVDRRIAAAALAAVTTFAVVCNLFFNYSGYATHIRSITDAAAQYRVFEPTSAGRWQLLVLTVQLVQASMGWPMFLASVAGVFIGFLTPRDRRTTVWLTAAIPAYYLGLINVVLYNYDRFMLPVCVVLSVFGGLALDRLLSHGVTNVRWRQVLVAGAFAYSFLYAATVDVLMIADSRYTVERWMTGHIDRETVVGAMGLHEYLPPLEDYHVTDIATVDELQIERPRYFVLNADYVRAADRGSEFARLADGVQSGKLGYFLSFRYRRTTPLSLLPGGHPDLVGDRRETAVFSILRNINPTIEVFERQERGPPGGEPSGP